MNCPFHFKQKQNDLIFHIGTELFWVSISSYNIKWNGNKNQLLHEEPTIQGPVAPNQHILTLIGTYILMKLEEDLIFLFVCLLVLPWEGYTRGQHVLDDNGVLGEAQNWKLHQSWYCLIYWMWSLKLEISHYVSEDAFIYIFFSCKQKILFTEVKSNITYESRFSASAKH